MPPLRSPDGRRLLSGVRAERASERYRGCVRAARVDSNAPDLVHFLLALGGSWTPLPPGTGRDKGRADGVWGFRGVTGLAEIKPVGEKRKPHQLEWARRWRGAPVHEWRTRQDVLRSLGLCVRVG